MREALLFAIVAAAFVFGYFLMKKLDSFFIRNRRRSTEKIENASTVRYNKKAKSNPWKRQGKLMRCFIKKSEGTQKARKPES